MAPVADDIRIHQDWPGPEEGRATGLAALEGRELQVIEQAAAGVVHGAQVMVDAPVTAREIVSKELAFLAAPPDMMATMFEEMRRTVEARMIDAIGLPDEMMRRPGTRFVAALEPPANPIRVALASNAIGRFRIGRDMIDHEAETVAEILAGLVIVRAEYRFEMHAVEYVAYGPDFLPAWPGSEPPLYVAEMCEEPHACGIKRYMTGWRRVD